MHLRQLSPLIESYFYHIKSALSLLTTSKTVCLREVFNHSYRNKKMNDEKQLVLSKAAFNNILKQRKVFQ